MQVLRKLRLRLRTVFFKSHLEAELDAEMRFHLDQQIAENIARGMTPEEAHYAALRKMGPVTQLQEQCREARGFDLVETSIQDIRYALRTLRNSPAFTLVAVLSLALGIGANLAIFSLIDSLLLNSLPVHEPRQLFFVQTSAVTVGNFKVSRTISTNLVQQIEKRATQIDGIASFNSEKRVSVEVAGATSLAPGQFVSGKYFQVLGVHARVGRTLTAADADPAANTADRGWPAMISDGYWRRRFGGNPDVLGTKLTVNTIPFVIVGVLPPRFYGVSMDEVPDLIMPTISSLQVQAGSISAGLPKPDQGAGVIFVRMKKDANPKTLAAELTVVMHDTELAAVGDDAGRRSSIEKMSIELEPAAAGASFLRRQFSKPLYVLMGVVALVMLIACANIASLLLARATARKKEIAIRLSLGSSRRRIIRQLLTESLILSAIGGVLGVGLAVAARKGIIQFAGVAQANADLLAMNWDWRMIAFVSGVCIFNALLFGTAPAFRATNLDPHEALKATQSTHSHSRLPLGRMLVVAQIALSLSLVIGAGLFLGTLRNLYQIDVGFNRDNLLMLTVDPHLIGYDKKKATAVLEQSLDRIQTLPSVTSASLSSDPLFSGRAHLSSAFVPGYIAKPGEDLANTWIITYQAGPRFFSTLQMPLLSGRDFLQNDERESRRVAIINEAMAKHYFDGRNPVGQRISFDPKKKADVEIIGVVGNAHYFDVRDESQSAIFTPLLQSPGDISATTFAIRTTSDPNALVQDIRSVLRQISPNLPVYDVTTMSRQVAGSFNQERLMAVLSSFFGLLALTLSAIGLYGVLAYGVSQRTSEIGIRMALGADRAKILTMVLGETGRMLIVGISIGLVISLGATRLITSLLFGITPNDARSFAVGTIVLLVVALVATMLPAKRAVDVDPMMALRYE